MSVLTLPVYTKHCYRCSTDLPLSAFTKNKQAADGLQSKCRECDKKYQAKRRIDNKEYLLKYGRNYQKNRRTNFDYRLQMLLNASKQRATAKGREHTITLKDLQDKYPKDGKCPIFGIELKFNTTGFNDTSPSIDRIDATKGYTKDNIQIISWKANSIKRNATLEELILLVNYLNQGE